MTRSFVYLQGQVLGWTDTKSGVSAKYYASTDYLGSVTKVTDNTATVVWSSEYLSFGKVAGIEGVYEFSGGFTGKDFDPDVNLYYFNARWYNADLGKFISEDPAGQGWNWYGYGANNPLLNVDPSGLWGFSFGGITFGWTSSGGFNIGFGIALDFDIGCIAVNIQLDDVYNFSNKSNTYNANIGAQVDIPNLVGISIGTGYSYNTISGSSAFLKLGACAFGFGFEVGTTQAWSKSGRYEGGDITAEGFYGSMTARAGGGYQWGWGGFKSGAFFEASALGISYNSLNGWSIEESVAKGQLSGDSKGIHANISSYVGAFYMDYANNDFGMQLDTLFFGADLNLGSSSYVGAHVAIVGGFEIGTSAIFAYGIPGSAGFNFEDGGQFECYSAFNDSDNSVKRLWGNYVGGAYQDTGVYKWPRDPSSLRPESSWRLGRNNADNYARDHDYSYYIGVDPKTRNDQLRTSCWNMNNLLSGDPWNFTESCLMGLVAPIL